MITREILGYVIVLALIGAVLLAAVMLLDPLISTIYANVSSPSEEDCRRAAELGLGCL